MSKTNVGANLVFARRTIIVCEPMSEANVSNSLSNIGLISVFVRRANIRFAPTLVLLICLIPVLVRRANTRFAPTLVCSFPGSAWERVLGGSAACSVRRWQSHLGKRSQAEPGNEHRSEFALA
jgi:hypothetical protein